MFGAILGALGKIGMDVAPSLLSSGANYFMQQHADSKAYRRQVKLLKMQQAYSTKMANTAHQREVKDLRKAGLNPILSATGGNGATSPVVSAPSVSTGSRQDFFQMDSFVDALKTGAEIDVAENTGKKLKADSDVAEATVKRINSEKRGVDLDNELKEMRVNYLKPLAKFSKDQTDDTYWKDVGRGTKLIVEKYLHSAQDVVADALKPLFVDKPSKGLGGNEYFDSSNGRYYDKKDWSPSGIQIHHKGYWQGNFKNKKTGEKRWFKYKKDNK